MKVPINLPNHPPGFTLTEVVMSIAIAAILFAGILNGYVMSAKRAELSAYSLAAHSLAMQKIEQARACKWDPSAYPAVDELISSNFPITIDELDIPVSGTNKVYATNFTVISNLPTTAPLKVVSVTWTWPFLSRGVYTNTMITYRAPDQ